MTTALMLACAGTSAADQGCSDAPVASLNAGLLEAMQLGPDGFEARLKLLGPVVDAAYDLPYVARLVLGKAYDSLSEAQHGAFAEQFAALVHATYARRFDGYDGERFIVREVRALKRSRCVVESVIRQADATEVRLDYVLHRVGEQWRIINVVAEGVSDLSLKRAQYAAVIQREGFASLLDKLKAQTARLAAG